MVWTAPHGGTQEARAAPVPAAEAPEAPQTGPEALNEAQQAAVEAPEPVVAVVAGPGTGKTKTLVSRIAYLVEQQGVRPDEITAVTFTNQAADEMRSGSRRGSAASGPWPR